MSDHPREFEREVALAAMMNRTFLIDVCPTRSCGYLVGADGESTTCPYCGTECVRLEVVAK